MNAVIAMCGPSPESEKIRYESVCEACGTYEGLFDAFDHPQLIELRDLHNYRFHGGAVPEHECDSGHFDRTICGCGAMHSYCATCGSRADDCPLDADLDEDGFADASLGRGMSTSLYRLAAVVCETSDFGDPHRVGYYETAVTTPDDARFVRHDDPDGLASPCWTRHEDGHDERAVWVAHIPDRHARFLDGSAITDGTPGGWPLVEIHEHRSVIGTQPARGKDQKVLIYSEQRQNKKETSR